MGGQVLRKSTLVVMLSLIVPAILLYGCASISAQDQSAPDIKLQDIKGNAIQLSSFKGKVIILDFFATWCPPCRQEIPDFIALQEEYKDKDFVMIGVSLTPLDDVKPFTEKLGINYTVLIGDDKAESAYGPIRSIPTTFVIDKDFKVAKKYIGFRAKEVFENDVKELLSK